MPITRYQSALLFGAPGSGKGTQGRVMGEVPGFFHLSCGDVFRNLDRSSQEYRDVNLYSSQGRLVPDETTIRIWKRHLDALTVLGQYKPQQDLLVLDGIPRNLRQAELVEEHIQVQMVVQLVCPDFEAMIRRIRRRAIKENRLDDASEDIIRRRFEIYQKETAPLLSHYPKSLVREVDAIGSPAEVLLKVLQILAPLQNSLFQRDDHT